MRCGEIFDYLEKEAPLYLQEDYDNSGLQWGNPDSEVQKVLICLDFTREAMNFAVKDKAGLVISHHPIMFRPMKRVNTGTGEGAMLSECIRENICVYAAHTNFDTAENGLNRFLAEKLELQDVRNLKTYYQEPVYKLVVFVPEESIDEVQKAIYRAGAGWIGQYSDCGFRVLGNGTFRPLEGTNPYIGRQGRMETVPEYRLETIVPHALLGNVVESMLKAHPYEDVAYDIYRLEKPGCTYGLGRVGTLKEKLTAEDFTAYVKEKLKVENVRTGAEKTDGICGVAVFCGSFDGDVKAVKVAGADALVTGDLKYHDAQELKQAGIFAVDAGHYHTEKLFIQAISSMLKKKFKDITIVEFDGNDIFDYR